MVPITPFHFHGRHSNRAFMLSTTLVELTSGFHVGKATAYQQNLTQAISPPRLPGFLDTTLSCFSSYLNGHSFPISFAGPSSSPSPSSWLGVQFSDFSSISTDSLGNPIASHVFINHVCADDCQIFISDHDLIYEFGSHIQHLT